jgi:hypothetical protein
MALVVDICPPEHFSMTVELSDGAQRLSQNFATHIHPFLESLIGTLRVLKQGGFVDDAIVLFVGAPECQLHIQADVGSSRADLRVDLWPDGGRSKFAKPETLIGLCASRDEIAASFAVALRQLRSNVSDQAFLEGYGAPFPTRAYDEMMKAMA